ncbi:hypothetical protein [Paenibacillus harenae]|uniref:Uncharacterized protein n=1 Tax=Paenibacillus harenae TaxID=306543 RepID=A0ABT9TTS3_PAEHA|nr:hypothetical protein [Paenibacillus harenae]MDQ0110746.1 hypothetical protein [Paenibacillus harenae]
MNHRHAHKNDAASAVATSISSILLSFLASSHHWLHTGILLIMGGSTNMMATMSGIVWLRRTMILVTVITSFYSVYRLLRHKRMPIWMKWMTVISLIISFGLIVYTLINFGW